ncbi:MAG: LysE family translocator [Burkholderiaceae bacterium]|nr:LysE family translocator [Burkholderiaceae bacterium]
MIPFEILGAFFIASVLLALAPGPDNIFVLTQSALRGRTAGLLVMLGLCTGLLVHTAAVALGVAAIFQASELAFNALKLAGAAYLLYLAWLSFRAGTEEIRGDAREQLTHGQLYRRGIIMNITNPKVSIFFLAFLPQFADPARGSLTVQMLLLGLVFIISTVLVFGGVALAAGALGEWLSRSARAQKVMNRVAGVVFIGLAIRLATVER